MQAEHIEHKTLLTSISMSHFTFFINIPMFLIALAANVAIFHSFHFKYSYAKLLIFPDSFLIVNLYTRLIARVNEGIFISAIFSGGIS